MTVLYHPIDTLTIGGLTSTTHYMPNSLNFVSFLSFTIYCILFWLVLEFRLIDYIATSATSGNVPSLSPAPTYWDLHIYSNPSKLVIYWRLIQRLDYLSERFLHQWRVQFRHFIEERASIFPGVLLLSLLSLSLSHPLPPLKPIIPSTPMSTIHPSLS